MLRTTPAAQEIVVNKGETPKAANGIANKDDLPGGTIFEFKTPVDTSEPGDQVVTVELTYPDGSKAEISVQIHVNDDAEANEPETQPLTVNKGITPSAEDAIRIKMSCPKVRHMPSKNPLIQALMVIRQPL